MSLKLKEEMNNLPMLDAFVDDNFSSDIELEAFAKKMKKEVIGVIDILSFLTKDDEKKTHKMLVLMLDLKI
jgi:hypothetical protein